MEQGERYDGEFEAAARESYLRRMQNLGRGWHPAENGRGWTDPKDLLRQLDEQRDPVEMRALAHMREAERQLEKRHEMEADFPRVTEFRPEWR